MQQSQNPGIRSYLVHTLQRRKENWGTIGGTYLGNIFFPNCIITVRTPARRLMQKGRTRASGGDQEESNPNTWTMGSYGDDGKSNGDYLDNIVLYRD